MAGYSNNEADYDALNKIISNSTYTSTVINGTDVSYKEDDVENVDFDEISNTASNSVYTNSTGYSVEVKDDPEERAARYEVNEQLSDLADFNGDGTFDYEDIKAMNDSLRSNTTDYGLTIGADMNGDLIFDEKDIQILTDYYNGKTSGKAFDVEYLKYKNSVLKSGYAKSHNVESLLTNFAIDHTSDVNALIDDYFISKTDFNNDGKIDQNDYVYAMNHKSEGLDKYSDLNGDGVFDDNDVNLLKTYLDGGDVTQSLNVNQVLMFSCKQDLKDYEAREKEYVDYIEYLESVDASKELINTIKSKKDAIQETMRAIKRRYSDLEKKDNYAFQHYERDMGVYWQKDIDYDKVADYYEEHKNLLNCPELQGKDVDIITVIDYITRERGIPIEHFEAEAPGAPGNGWYWYYDLMSENERKAFQYQYRYNGKSAAMNYFNDLKTELDKRQEGKGAGYNKNKSWARNNKENESDPNYLSKMYKKHQSLIKRIKDLSDEQKKYYHFILDTEGEQAAYDYLENADYSQALNPEYQKNSISTINQTDYVKEYLLTKVDLNNDGKIDQNDYVYATTHRSSGLDKYSDLNGDGKFDDNDLNILKSYLDGKDVSASLDGQSFMKNTYELQNKEYDEKIAGLVKQQEKLKKLIEKLSSGDDYESSEIDGVEVSFTKEEAQKMLDQVSTEISQLKMLIKDNKQMILELPYFNMMMTPEYQEFASNYDCKNINNIDYEQLLYDYEHQGSNGQLGHTYETEDNPVDWFAVIEYLVEEKGLSISEMGAFNTTYIDYMSMDESQRMMYHYLFKTKGKEEASHYFNDIIKDPRRQREAKFRVDRKIKEMDCTYSVDENGNIVDVKLDSSFRNLVSTFGEGMDDAITGNYAGIFKWGEDGYTEEEYEKMYLMQYLAKNDTLNSSYGAGQVGGGVATALVTTAAFTGTSLLTGGTAAAAWAPYLVNVVSIGTAVANQGGEANHYALLNGNSQEAANQYAFQIMKNSLFRQACSSVVGKGIGSSAQFLSLLRGGNSLGFLGNMAVSSANILADASTSVWEKAQEQNLKEALLNEAPLDADSANSQLLEVFMSNVAMGALQQLPTAALSYYRFKKGGETFEFSADDWLSYKNSNPEATAEDFMNFYSGSKVITSDGSFHDTKTTTTSSDYLKQARSTLEGVYRGLDGDSNAVLTDLERKSLKYAVDNMNDADKMELFRYSRAEELDALLDSGIRITDEQANIIIKRYGYSNRQEMIAEGGLARLSAIDNSIKNNNNYVYSRAQYDLQKIIQSGALLTEAEFRSYCAKLNIDSTVVDNYINKLYSDSTLLSVSDISKKYSWDSSGRFAEEIMKMPKSAWDAMSESDKNAWVKAYNNDAVLQKKLGKNFNESANTILATIENEKNGIYTISAEEVIQRRIDAKSGKVNPQKKVEFNGIDYTSYLPSCDDFISDKGLYDYTMELTGLTQTEVNNYLTSKGINAKSQLEGLAIYLKDNHTTVKGTTFQNGAPGTGWYTNSSGNTSQEWDLGTSNLERFGAVGGPNDPKDPAKRNGGAYSLVESPSSLAKKYPEYCKLDNGKLVITDYKGFGEVVLAGVPLSDKDGCYIITYEMPVGQTGMPSVNNNCMYTAYGVPGGRTSSGNLEVVMPPYSIPSDKIGDGSTGKVLLYTETDASGQKYNVYNKGYGPYTDTYNGGQITIQYI